MSSSRRKPILKASTQSFWQYRWSLLVTPSRPGHLPYVVPILKIRMHAQSTFMHTGIHACANTPGFKIRIYMQSLEGWQLHHCARSDKQNLIKLYVDATKIDTALIHLTTRARTLMHPFYSACLLINDFLGGTQNLLAGPSSHQRLRLRKPRDLQSRKTRRRRRLALARLGGPKLKPTKMMTLRRRDPRRRSKSFMPSPVQIPHGTIYIYGTSIFGAFRLRDERAQL